MCTGTQYLSLGAFFDHISIKILCVFVVCFKFGIARCNSEAVFDELHACFKSKWEHVEGLIEYIEKKIFPVILHHMLKPTWYEGTPPMWTNNNSESMNNILTTVTRADTMPSLNRKFSRERS